MSSVPFTVRLKPETKQALDNAAKSLDRTPGYIVNQAIQNYLQAELEKETAILSAIEKADAGLLVSEKAVDDWLDSLDTPNPLDMPKAADGV